MEWIDQPHTAGASYALAAATHDGPISDNAHQRLAESPIHGVRHCWAHRRDIDIATRNRIIADRSEHADVRCALAISADADHQLVMALVDSCGWYGRLVAALHPQTCDDTAARLLAGYPARHRGHLWRTLACKTHHGDRISGKPQLAATLIRLANDSQYCHTSKQTPMLALAEHVVVLLDNDAAGEAVRAFRQRDEWVQCAYRMGPDRFHLAEIEPEPGAAFTALRAGVLDVWEQNAGRSACGIIQDRQTKLWRWKTSHVVAWDLIVELYATPAGDLLSTLCEVSEDSLIGMDPLEAAQATMMIAPDEHLGALIDEIVAAAKPEPYASLYWDDFSAWDDIPF